MSFGFTWGSLLSSPMAGVSNSFLSKGLHPVFLRGPEGRTGNWLYLLGVHIKKKMLSSIYRLWHFRCSLTVKLSFRWLLVSWTQSKNCMNVSTSSFLQFQFGFSHFNVYWSIFKGIFPLPHKIFLLLKPPVGQIGTPCGPHPACRPYVWHPCSMAYA